LNGRIEIGLDEIEEGFEVGVTAVFGLLLSALIDFVQKREDLLGSNGSKVPLLAEVIAKLVQRGTIRLNRIFFPNSSCGILDRLASLVRVSWHASCLGCGWVKTDGHYDRNVRYPSQPCKNSGWL